MTDLYIVQCITCCIIFVYIMCSCIYTQGTKTKHLVCVVKYIIVIIMIFTGNLDIVHGRKLH